jgi:hypothetical protein
MAAELQHTLDKNFGVVKTSSDLSSILNPGIEDIRLGRFHPLIGHEGP